MQDVPFVVSALFSKTVQTAPYESEKAEVSAQFQVSEGNDAQAAIESGMSMVKRQVLIALGKAEGKLTAVATEPTKRGPGRPKKEEDKPADTRENVEKQVQVVPADKVETKQEVVEDDDFSDPPAEKPAAITDKELQDACSVAAKVITAQAVKDLFQKKYGAQRVSLIKAEERAAFKADLDSMVKAKKEAA